MAEVFEYRGVEGLVIAEVIGDDNAEDGGYKTGAVESLAGVAEIGKTVEISKETKYYDNQPMMNITGEGPDEISVICSGLPLEKLAKITGKSYDPETGAFVDGPADERYFAMGYITEDTDGFKRYVWRYKGSFSIPPESAKTKKNDTETNNTELTFTGIMTTHKFTKGKFDGTKWVPAPSKGLVVSDREDLADLSTFFNTVTTMDTLKKKTA